MITRWRVADSVSWPVRTSGVALLVAGGSVLVSAFAGFVTEGLGTPAPVAPTQRLVIGGPYRYVRNPMYLAVLAAIAGQALILGRTALVAYGFVVAVAFVVFVPALRRTDPEGDVRRRVRDLPACRSRMVAPSATMDAR